METFGEMLDTPPAQRERYFALLRAMTVQQRAEKMASLSQSMRELALAGLRQRFPGASAEELQRQLAVRLYGDWVLRRLRRRGE